MATYRDTPYSAFNFLVELGEESSKEVKAGFAEASGFNLEITAAEYRNGNEAENYVHKIPGIHKAGDITLKRGVIGAENIWKWLEVVRSGNVAESKRNIVIHLLNEDRSDVAVSWKLINAMPTKWTGPSLTAKGGGDVAMEELVLSVESITQE